jgi:hypothetical protein
MQHCDLIIVFEVSGMKLQKDLADALHTEVGEFRGP